MALADDAADGAFAADQNGLDVAAVLVRHQIGDKARAAGKMHDLDVVAGTVKQVPRIGLAWRQMRRDQRKVGVVETPQTDC